jgi:hypothetical protein
VDTNRPRSPASSPAFNQKAADGAEETVMRIVDVTCSLALLTLAANSAPSPATVDPNNDFDCAVVYDFFHRMAKAKQAPADLLEETSAMNSWFIAKWMEHAGESPGRREHYVAMLTAMSDNPKAYGNTLNACSARANSDPLFDRFVKAFRSTVPAAH